MEKCIVLSDGDKLKKIRKKYNVKQEDITGNEITRNLISEIENNKASITKKTAEVIIKNLNEIAKKKNFKVVETVAYLMENQIAQATKALDNYIEELKTLSISKGGSFIKILKETESFLIDWDIKDKKLKVYELAGDYFCNNNEMYKSVVYYEKASALLSRMFLDKELLPLSRKLSMVYCYIGDYKKSIECCEFALSRFENISQKDKVVFRYNNALNYKRVNNFEKALKNINIAEDLIDKQDTSNYIRILNNKGNCFYEMKMYREAIDIFLCTLDLIDKNNAEQYIINLINIFNCYWFLNLKDKAMQNFDILLKELPNLNNFDEYLPEIYFEVGKIYEKLNKPDITENYYIKALDYSEKQKNYVFTKEVLYALIEMYIVDKDVEKMNKIKEKVFYLANIQHKINNGIMYKLIVFYTENNKDVVKQIANFALIFK